MSIAIVCPACAGTYGGVIDSACPVCIGFGCLDLGEQSVRSAGARAAARAVQTYLGGYAPTSADIGRRAATLAELTARAERLRTVGLLVPLEGAPDFNDDAWQPDPGNGSVGRSLTGRAAGALLVSLGVRAGRPPRPRGAAPTEPGDVARALTPGPYVPPRVGLPDGVADLTDRRVRRRS